MTFHITVVGLGASVRQNKVCVCVWLSNAAVNLLLYNRRARAEREEKTEGRLVPLSL